MVYNSHQLPHCFRDYEHQDPTQILDDYSTWRSFEAIEFITVAEVQYPLEVAMNVHHNKVKYADAAHQMKTYGQLSMTFGGKVANQQIPIMMEKKTIYLQSSQACEYCPPVITRS